MYIIRGKETISVTCDHFETSVSSLPLKKNNKSSDNSYFYFLESVSIINPRGTSSTSWKMYALAEKILFFLVPSVWGKILSLIVSISAVSVLYLFCVDILSQAKNYLLRKIFHLITSFGRITMLSILLAQLAVFFCPVGLRDDGHVVTNFFRVLYSRVLSVRTKLLKSSLAYITQTFFSIVLPHTNTHTHVFDYKRID